MYTRFSQVESRWNDGSAPSATNSSGEGDATYVDAAFLSFSHGLCGSGTDWINGVQFSGPYPLPLSLHPNLAGEKSYAGRVLMASWFN